MKSILNLIDSAEESLPGSIPSALQVDDLALDTYPRAILALFNCDDIAPTDLGKFNLKCHRESGTQYFEVKTAAYGTHSVDLVSLFAFIVSAVPQRPFFSAFLGIENALHFKLSQAAGRRVESSYSHFLKLAEILEPPADRLQLDAAAKTVLQKAGFQFPVDPQSINNIKVEQLEQFRRQFSNENEATHSVPRMRRA